MLYTTMELLVLLTLALGVTSLAAAGRSIAATVYLVLVPAGTAALVFWVHQQLTTVPQQPVTAAGSALLGTLVVLALCGFCGSFVLAATLPTTMQRVMMTIAGFVLSSIPGLLALVVWFFQNFTGWQD